MSRRGAPRSHSRGVGCRLRRDVVAPATPPCVRPPRSLPSSARSPTYSRQSRLSAPIARASPLGRTTLCVLCRTARSLCARPRSTARHAARPAARRCGGDCEKRSLAACLCRCGAAARKQSAGARARGANDARKQRKKGVSAPPPWVCGKEQVPAARQRQKRAPRGRDCSAGCVCAGFQARRPTTRKGAAEVRLQQRIDGWRVAGSKTAQQRRGNRRAD